MTVLTTLPLLAYLGCAVVVIATATGTRLSPVWRWRLLALLAALFGIFSCIAVAQDGLWQFWINHTTNLTGNQVWLDLVIAVTLSFYLMAPRAAAVGMRLLPWGIAVILTACIALLPMLARIIWLEQQQPQEGN